MYKLLPIIGLATLLNGSLEFLSFYILTDHKNAVWPFPLLLIGWIATYIVVLLFAKRAALFQNNRFLIRLGKSLLICIPIIIYSSILFVLFKLIVHLLFQGKLFSTGIHTNFENIDLIGFIFAFAGLYQIKFILAFVVGLIFSIRLGAFMPLSEEEELKLYGSATKGIIYRKWQQSGVWLVRAEYFVNGKRYETGSKLDRKNSLAQHDTVTIIYSLQHPEVSVIEEVADEVLKSFVKQMKPSEKVPTLS